MWGGRPIFVDPSDGTVFQSPSLGNHALALFNGVDFGVSVQVPQEFTQPTLTVRQHYSVQTSEPATLALRGPGLVGLAAAGLRRRD